jgi:hypothetical protein
MGHDGYLVAHDAACDKHSRFLAQKGGRLVLKGQGDGIVAPAVVPTTAFAMASRMALVGFVTVSLLKSIKRIGTSPSGCAAFFYNIPRNPIQIKKKQKNRANLSAGAFD